MVTFLNNRKREQVTSL